MQTEISLPKHKGSYVLVLHLDGPKSMFIGKLGKYSFKKGVYLYVGSAFGAGGLAGRLKHHLKPSKNPHWHIDYFKQSAKIIEIWHTKREDRLEHQWADILADMNDITIPVAGFGSSDCKCRSHFFFVNIDKNQV